MSNDAREASPLQDRSVAAAAPPVSPRTTVSAGSVA